MSSINLVSIIIPTYDDDEYLEQAIESILDQTTEEVYVEIIILDSSTTDSVREIAASYGDQVRYEWVPPEGVAAARNRGIEIANGEVIGFCDADDYWHPEKLEQQIPKIEAGADVVYSDEYLLTEGGRKVRLESPPVTDPENHHIAHVREGGVGSRSVLVRRECLEAERFDESFIMREDPHLWTRLFAEYEPAKVDDALTYKRKRAGSLTADKDTMFEMQLKEINSLIDRFPELEPYREDQIQSARLLYAKNLILDDGRTAEARQQLIAVLKSGNRSARCFIFLAATLVPIGGPALLRAVRSVYWRIGM